MDLPKILLTGLVFLFFCFFFGFPRKKYVNIPSEKYIYVHYIYVCICVYTYLCKMDERRSFASLS